jgi:fructose-bisphosphate aldolase class II
MPLVTDYNDVLAIYRDAAKRKIGLPVFCAEDRETLEAILASALEYGKRIGVNDLPIIPAWTSRYPPRSQMALVSACGNPRLGHRLFFSDLDVFSGPDSPYRQLRIMPHLDHAFPWLDADVLIEWADRFASVMCDASEKPLDENIRITAEYVRKVKGKVVVEGAVDEIPDSARPAGGIVQAYTLPEQARRFLKETGVDIIVPNVGTEHRATGTMARYNAEAAKAIGAAVGSIMCLHGTSSVPHEILALLPAHGFVKINIYTTLAVHGGQALARNVLLSLGHIFDKDQLQSWIDRGVLGPAVLDKHAPAGAIGPRLRDVTNPPRRDAWFSAVRDRCLDYLDVLGYGKFAV